MRDRSDGLLRHLRVPVIGIALVSSYGVIGYVLFGFGFIDALYMTSLALTTAGFNPVGDLTQGEKAFTITIAVFGVTLFLVILALLTSLMVEGRIGIVSRRRRMDKRIGSMKGHFIIAAYGRVGRTAARELEAEGVPFVVVDRLEELEPIMQSDGVPYLLGDPTSESVLQQAGIERARALISAVDSDADNVYITLTARSMNPDLFIVARASEPKSPERLYRAGANRVISPYVSSGRHMAMLALRPRVVDYLEISGRDEKPLRLEEFLVEEDSPLVGHSVDEVGGAAVPLVVRRASGEVVTNPNGSEDVRAGDLIVLLGAPVDLRRAEGR
ncbi:MAG TPA: potassium channel protein [Actinomycetota bacterium]